MSEFKRFFQSKMPLLWAAVLLLNAVLLLGAHSTNREAAHIRMTNNRTFGAVSQANLPNFSNFVNYVEMLCKLCYSSD